MWELLSPPLPLHCIFAKTAVSGVALAASLCDHESESSGDEGAGGRSNADQDSEARVAEAVPLEEEGRRRRAARARLIAVRPKEEPVSAFVPRQVHPR